MRKILLVLCCFLSISLSFAGTMPVVPVPINQNNFTIRLPANPTTGYMWTVKSYDKKYLRFIKKKYSRGGNKNLMGAGGVMNFYFTCVPGVKKPQHTDVELLYSRPWEKGSGQITKVAVVFTKK